MESLSKKDFIAKISFVMDALGAIPKTAENSFQHYNYRSHEAIANKLQPILTQYGVVIVPKSKKIIFSEPGYVLMEVTFEITDGTESLEFVGIGEGIDKNKEGRAGDKASYKAQTGAMKYALNDLFMLASKDDAEADEMTKTEITNEKHPEYNPTEKPNETVKKEGGKVFNVIGGPDKIPKDWKENKAKYISEGYACRTNDKGVWQWGRFGDSGNVIPF
jgi:hypothetical protein